MLKWKLLVLTLIVCVVLDNMSADASPTAEGVSQETQGSFKWVFFLSLIKKKKTQPLQR